MYKTLRKYRGRGRNDWSQQGTRTAWTENLSVHEGAGKRVPRKEGSHATKAEKVAKPAAEQSGGENRKAGGGPGCQAQCVFHSRAL